MANGTDSITTHRYANEGASSSPKQPSHHHYSYNRSGASSPVTVPPSPSTTYAESQHSMDEYEMDSPSSLSSWNSFMSGHRGDLADVEDLELGEPELETVSEMDEGEAATTAFSGGSPDQRLTPTESEDEERSGGHRKSDGLHRRRTLTQQHYVHSHGSHHHHHHHHHHGYNHNNHGHGHHSSPSFSHFSPRAGGHGLSHHSRWTSRTPASIAARRHKGRIAELAEEGAGEPHGINTTSLSAAVAANDRGSNRQTPSPIGAGSVSPGRSDTLYPGTPPSTQWSDFAGPPAPPQFRPVSPSETVPAVPSPLCECISAAAHAEAQNVGGDLADSCSTALGEAESVLQQSTATVGSRDDGQAAQALPAPTPRRGVLSSETHDAITGQDQDNTTPSTSPSTTATTNASSISSMDADFASRVQRQATPSSPDTTPPTSPVQPLSKPVSRRNSGRSARRSASPPRPHRHKQPLRPCFSRRNSYQTASSSASDQSEQHPPRGRCHVHFSSAPPQTMRTHSPVDYDRSSCPVSNKLSKEDVEEMQRLEMEMGLLSAKCSAIAALTSCKLPVQSLSESVKTNDVETRPRRDSTGMLAHTPGGGWPSSNKNRLSPAEHLRMQREKERERACRLAGIGNGIGGRNLGRGAGGQSTNPLIARFGLNTPPPPLPGTHDPFKRHTEPSSAPATPVTSTPQSFPGDDISASADKTLTPTTTLQEIRGPRASSLQRTPNEDRAIRRSLACVDSDHGGEGGEDSTARGRSTTRPVAKEVPALVHTSPSPSPPRKTVPLVAEDPVSPLKTPQPSPKGKKTSYFDDSPASTPSQTSLRSPSHPMMGCGYDSPSSAYESGSEYDLLG